MRAGSLFSGIGLLDYGLHLAGVEHAWFCEADPWRREILRKRWPGVPVFDDVRALSADALPPCDGVVGGFPCKGASTAGKRTGFDHPETVLWREMARVVGEVRPRYVVVENVANIVTLKEGRVWAEVLSTLASLGFDVEWDCLPAAAVGAPHLRDRVFAVASHADGADGGRHGGERRGQDGRADATPRLAAVSGAGDAGRGVAVEWGDYEPAIRRWEAVHGPAPEPLVRRVDDRSAARVERSRLSALGDGVQVQVGRIVGEYVMSLEREALREAA